MNESSNRPARQLGAERQRMMDAFEHKSVHSNNSNSNGTNTTSVDVAPAAKVIRSSNHRPPSVTAVSKKKKRNSNNIKTKTKTVSFQTSTSTQATAISTGTATNSIEEVEVKEKSVSKFKKSVMKSNLIKERNPAPAVTSPNVARKVSRFKLKQNKSDTGAGTDIGTASTSNNATNHIITKNGFPSFDLPIGSFTRRSSTATTASVVAKHNRNRNDNNATNPQELNNKNITNEANSMLSNMTHNEIQSSIQEIESTLSIEMIEFLKRRNKEKQKQNEHHKKESQSLPSSSSSSKIEKDATITSDPTIITTTNNTDIITTTTTTSTTPTTATATVTTNNNTSMIEKNEYSKLLSNIQTEEELDELYQSIANNTNNTITNSSSNTTTNNNNNTQLQQQQHQSIQENKLYSATKLLRSTVLRQRLFGAKMIKELLLQQLQQMKKKKMEKIYNKNNGDDNDDNKNNGDNIDEDYPTLLPVALRCILDLPNPEKHFVLFHNVVRSIHLLILLFAHEENHVDDWNYTNLNNIDDKNNNNHVDNHHDNDEGGGGEDQATLHQLYYLNDNVPLRPSHLLYSATQSIRPTEDDNSGSSSSSSNNTTSNVGGACYTTDSSAESAEKDGKAFYTDPLWTLLSRMRIIPCLSRIITSLAYQKNNGGSGDSHFHVEIVSSICAILSMLSLRSPGAACAIAQHKDTLPLLISMTLEPLDGTREDDDNDVNADKECAIGSDFIVNPDNALSTVRLICTLCRQSRTIATSNWISSVMNNVIIILSTSVEHKKEWRLQIWCIILWRTLLRYGLALSYTPSILSLSIPHLTVQDEQRFSLTPYYLTSYAVICDYVRVTATTNGNSNNTEESISDRKVLTTCGIWFMSHCKSCIQFLEHIGHASSAEKLSLMRLASARLNLITSYIEATNAVKDQQDFNADDLIPLISRFDSTKALHGVLRSNLFIQAVEIVLNASDLGMKTQCKLDACSCSLVYSFFTALLNLVKGLEIDQSQGEDALVHLMSHTYTIVQEMLNKSKSLPVAFHEQHNSSRKNWRNRAQFSIVDFMTTIVSNSFIVGDINAYKAALPSLQSFAFSLLGRLCRGEEAMAAIIISHNDLFQVIPNGSGGILSARHIQQVLIHEIFYASHQSQVQLNHTFKLLGWNNMLAYGSKSLHQLESLRSEADRSMKPQGDTSDDSNEDFEVLSLPLGDDWLYKLLCGKIDLGNDPAEKEARIQGTSSVVISALQLIMNFDQRNKGFTEHIPIGSKFYFLSNVCLFPEELIRQNEISSLFKSLFQLYATQLSEKDEVIARSFILSCFRHSTEQLRSKHIGKASVTDDQIIEFFFSSSGIEEKKLKLSPKYFKAVDDFISDICASFVEYGAQYEIFSKCIRFLLMPDFPSRNRLLILNRLKDLMHLLTTEEELQDLNCDSIKKSLTQCFAGGLPIKDGSCRDSSELLDIIATYIKNDKCNTAEKGGFFYLFAVGSLARNLASSSIKCECGLKAMKRRMMNGLQQSVLDHISTVALRLMKDEHATKQKLVDITIHTCLAENRSEESVYQRQEILSDNVWEKLVIDLQKT